MKVNNPPIATQAAVETQRIRRRTGYAMMGLALLLGLAMPAVATAQFLYTTNAETITIIQYTGPGGDVIIPDATNGLPVTSIGDWAFYKPSSSLTNVTIPSSVTSIGFSAFNNCTHLVSIALPNSVTNLGLYVFSGCTSLTNVTLSTGLTSVATGAFSSCSNLASVVIPASVTSIGDWAFYRCTGLTGIYFRGNAPSVGASVLDGDNSVIVYYLPGTTGWGPTFGGRPTMAWPAGDWLYEIHSGAAIITGYIGAGGAVTIPDIINGLPVISIGNDAFQYENSLTSITISEGVTSIGEGALLGCSSLVAVGLPNTVTNLGASVFHGCASLASVTIPNGVTLISDGTFAFCSGLTNVALPDSVTSIGVGAFARCDGLTTLTLPNNLASIGEGAFSDCASLTGVVIPDRVTGIGGSAFLYCTSLLNITIPTNVTSLGEATFTGCVSLTNVTILIGVTHIGDGAFELCTSLTGIFIPASVTSIGEDVFYGCSSLTDITVEPLNAYYVSVAGVLFNHDQTTLLECPGGKAGSYAVPDGVTRIVIDAFSGCGSLTEITIPASVTNLGSWAFYYCTSLASIVLPDAATSIGEHTFEGCASLTNVVIGTNVASIGSEAFSGCSSLINITVPSSVTNLEDLAFAFCPNLAGIYFHGNVPSAVSLFDDATQPTIYYLFGTTGWGPTFAGRPTVMLSPLVPYTYTTNSGTITITKYTGSDSVVIIPSQITGLPVISLGDSAFASNTSLTSVTIPDGVTSLGGAVFSGCTSLTNVVIPNGVTNLGERVFENCASLAGIKLPASLSSLGATPFVGCASLTAITVDAANVVYSSLEGVLFNLSQTSLLACPGGKAGSYTVPGGVTNLGDHAFSGCGGLTNLTVPGSVLTLGDLAFSSCTNLTAVYFLGNAPSAVSGFDNATQPLIYYWFGTTGWDAIFAGRTTVVLYPPVPYTYTTIGGTVTITKYLGLDSVVAIPSQITGLPVVGLGDSAFASNASLSSVTIPDGVTSLGGAVFSGCTSLTNILLPSGVTNIGDRAFEACAALLSVRLPASVNSLGATPFIGCGSLTSIEVAASNAVYSSVEGVLFNLSQTTLLACPGGKAGSYTVPGGVTNLGDHAFSGCSGLTNIIVSGNVTALGELAFSSCTNLSAINFLGNAPSAGLLFDDVTQPTIYYLFGTTGWGASFAGRTTVMLSPVILTRDGHFGARTNQFGFTISGSSGMVVVVEAGTTLAHPNWSPLLTNTLTSASFYFSDPDWTNHPARFYRLRSP